MKIWDVVIYNWRWYEKDWSLDEEVMIVNSIRFNGDEIYEINWKCIDWFRKLSEIEKIKFII